MHIQFFSICIYVLCVVFLLPLKGMQLVNLHSLKWKIVNPCDVATNNVFVENNSSLWMFSAKALLFLLSDYKYIYKDSFDKELLLAQNCSSHSVQLALESKERSPLDIVDIPTLKPMKYGRDNVFDSLSVHKLMQNNSVSSTIIPTSLFPTLSSFSLIYKNGYSSLLSNSQTLSMQNNNSNHIKMINM